MRLLPASAPRFFLWTALALSPHAVLAESRVERIEVIDASDGPEIAIRASAFRGSKPEFSLFRLQNPTRVVVDLPGVDVAGLESPSSGNGVAAITTTQFRGRNGPVGRVVVVLTDDVDVDAEHRGDALVITTKRSATKTAPPAVKAATSSSETPVIALQGTADATMARTLKDVSARERDGGAIVQLLTDGEVARYEIEEVVDPPRLVIDLYGITIEGKGLERTFQGTPLRGARVGKHADKTRIVLDTRAGSMPSYDVASTSEGLAVMLTNSAPARSVTADVRGVAFDQKNGFWRLRLDTSGSVTVKTVKNSPTEKVLSLEGAKVQDGLLGSRGLSGGPVSDVIVERNESRGAVLVHLVLAEPVEDSAWQRDGSVYWDVRRSAALADQERVQPTAAPFSSGPVSVTREVATAQSFRGKKITVDMQDAEMTNVIKLLGDVSGKNVVIGEDVKGKVTVKLKNVPWDQALDVVLKTKDLGREERGGIIRVVPQAKLDAERDARLKRAEDLEKKLPTTVRLIPVNYAIARDLSPQVKELLSARGKVTFDARTNVIIVEDIRDNLDQAERLVRTLDTQTPQVLIEARMVEGTTTFTRALGIQWGGGLFFSQRGGNPTGLAFPNNVGIAGGADGVAELGGQPTPGVAFPSNFAVNLPAQNVTSGVGLNLGSVGNFGFVNARLTAAEATGQAKIMSAPRVTTLNNTRARITQGTDITVPIVTQNALTVQTVRAALELDVTPHVTADGSILMAIKLTNNVPDFAQQVGQGVPPVSTKEAETEMLVADGDTAVIGGIYTRNTAENYAQTPLLGSIPILGWLFKRSAESDSRSEMLVFITPRIVNRRSATLRQGGL
jgi:type IV pilus assembly protein PilQ